MAEQYKSAQERCKNWVKNIRQDESNETVDSAISRKQAEKEDVIETDSEFDSVSECGTKRRKICVQLKVDKLELLCEWRGCSFTCKSVDQFVKHVAHHVTEVDVEEISESEVYVCLWSGCNYKSAMDLNIIRHVNYHAFHSKLKSIGANVRNRVKLPKCQRDKEWKNILESLPNHDCLWEDCETLSFSNYQTFLYHTSTHAENNPRGNKVEGGIDCQWSGCKGNYASLYKLKEHLRVHTREKIIACPDCGSMFASNRKFYDHCKRQISLEVQGFQCSHCHKFYPTECLLREHMRNHIFHYKCNMCDMSCDSPSGLAKHVLYRHTTTRNFPCNLCSHAAKSQKDLDSHMTLHTDRSNYTCNIEGCLYFCKNAYTLDRHIEKIHRLQIRWYCCHECPIKYKKSYQLTRHLMEVHHLQWLKGHKRFQYVLEDDGCYRLQTIRYESTDENISSNNKDTPSAVNYKYQIDECCLNRDEKSTVAAAAKSLPTIQNILISIDEIDEHGNVIESQIIETQETNVLPPSIDGEPPSHIIILT